ncbi:uncharacterized protein LOC113376179 [Ctenocephalides felis]|uniref:uncharacterized protein LOC113376179 n=1 Tax=Ctenocephalides felis TaxID=7515 RepID=UPI000E6E576D|nr:uncharacterized protein LOC113376179 [Ctenocephalides felis]
MPAPRAHSQGMINQYSGSVPTLRLLCSITGGTTRAQWEDVTGSTPLTFVNDCVSFTTTVSARFWLMDCRNISEATKMATELYREAIHVPFMAKFAVFAKRTDPLEARLRVFCMTDDREDKTLEHQEHFTEVAKSRDVEVLEGKTQYIELSGNLAPVTKPGDQLRLSFRAFRENRLPFSVRVKDPHADAVGRALFMREPRVAKGEPPQQPVCALNIMLPAESADEPSAYSTPQRRAVRPYSLRVADVSNLLADDWERLAVELDIPESEIRNIRERHPDRVAQQAQTMLTYWQTRAADKPIGMTLELALRRIGRDDIVPHCANVEGRESLLPGQYYETDIMKTSESVEELIHPEDNRLRNMRERVDKYMAEEKDVEDEEANSKRTVAERRIEIEKRLSAERQIPASTQKSEIVQEITDIKRHSVVEDTISKHEDVILSQKLDTQKPDHISIAPIKTTITTVTTRVTESSKTDPSEKHIEIVKSTTKTGIPVPLDSDLEAKLSAQKEKIDTSAKRAEQILVTTTIKEITTDTKAPKVETITTKTKDYDPKRSTSPSDQRRDSALLEGVTESLGKLETTTYKITTADVADEVGSPKVGKTPPPSPAEFNLRDHISTAERSYGQVAIIACNHKAMFATCIVR